MKNRFVLSESTQKLTVVGVAVVVVAAIAAIAITVKNVMSVTFKTVEE